ncbi:tRNA (adenosine(37)-N6)-threonylcarbamoyltransferase complex dimerization subunit type 1 TsaB [Falsiphaeobacter marinintestinus]|uniref:tRNA (adenosine(37)-N6)-threonylcarbamoyltransferase complex dimerization subunit type 1 TsaB n=1 Tax=Falsiphaeobacter marinintestinus TaxID=1492905 RepID=UPI0011B6783A|nr:tRNA (adenosine(37)-N6)-threonylcarbamoyltransferase complex dimerization subunit type 1 TsaB [Phaeobacter marinintestinus]
MTDTPLILAFDTSAAYCAAALMLGDQLLETRAEDMTRGQAERLMPLMEELLQDHAKTWSDLDAIGVGVGPGNFTGIRIAVSAARGLALGLGAPAYGVSGFDARAEAVRCPGLASVPAPRDQVYLRDAAGETALMPLEQAKATAAQAGLALLPQPTPQDLAAAIGRVALSRWPKIPEAPAPLYLRAADAAPSSDTPPVLLDP